MCWRIYYADFSTFSHTDGEVYDAPAWGVIFVTTMLPQWWGRFGENHYWWTGDRWEGGDYHGLIDYLQQPGPRKVLWGRTIPDEQYSAILNRALHDEEYPQQ